MDDLQEALTRYMVRRASSRKIRDRNTDSNFIEEHSQIKYHLSRTREFSSGTENHRSCDRTDHSCNKEANATNNSCNNNNNENVCQLQKKWERSIENLVISPDGNSSTGGAKAFRLGNPITRKRPSEKSINKNSHNSITIEDISGKGLPRRVDGSRFEDEPVRLSKVRETQLDLPLKMMTESRKIGTAENRPIVDNVNHDSTQSSITSLTRAIENLDVQIKNLETRDPPKSTFATTALVENAARIYPVLEDVKFHPTGYTPRKNVYSRSKYYIEPDNVPRTPENQTKNDCDGFQKLSIANALEDIGKTNRTYVETRKLQNSETFAVDERSENDRVTRDKNESVDAGLVYQETPRSSRKMPIMESTRKSLHSDFPMPSRVDPNSISTIGTSDDTRATKDKRIGETDTFDETLPYDVQHFLEDALGDEILNSTDMTYGTREARDRTNSHFDASELMSHDGTPLRRRIVRALEPPMTEPTYKRSSALDRSMEICRSFTQTIKKKFQSSSGNRVEERRPIGSAITTVGNETDKIRQLLHEVNVQQTLVNQATKALNLCNSTKEFIDSPERIESERLLLLSSLRKKSVVEEIKEITSEAAVKSEINNDGQRGEITLSEISLNLRESANRETTDNETIEWFVLIVSQGFKVWATQPMSHETGDSKIRFSDKISIPNLTPNFKIHVEVYTMKIRKSTYNHEEKYRIRRRERRNTSCPPCPNILVSPARLLKKSDEGPCSSAKIHCPRRLENRRGTSFVLSGFLELFLHDLSLFPPWPLMLVPANSILRGTVDLNIACRLHLSVSHEGFVNHAEKAGGFAVWNRRWCVLKGHTLLFWNYPDEQETKEPLKIVDLIDCVSSEITTADRTICAKPRTLLFETALPRSRGYRDSIVVERTDTCAILRNLISLDSAKELMEWSAKLNRVVTALREWNVISVRKQLQISDL